MSIKIRRTHGQERVVPDLQARAGLPVGSVHMPLSRRALEHRRRRARGLAWWLYLVPVVGVAVGCGLIYAILYTALWRY